MCAWKNPELVLQSGVCYLESRSIVRRDAVVVLAGGAANYFARGRYLGFQSKLTFADMLVSCFHYMGCEDVTKFGDDRLNDGAPLPGLTSPLLATPRAIRCCSWLPVAFPGSFAASSPKRAAQRDRVPPL